MAWGVRTLRDWSRFHRRFYLPDKCVSGRLVGVYLWPTPPSGSWSYAGASGVVGLLRSESLLFSFLGSEPSSSGSPRPCFGQNFQSTRKVDLTQNFLGRTYPYSRGIGIARAMIIMTQMAIEASLSRALDRAEKAKVRLG